jgi:hypothetical protein
MTTLPGYVNTKTHTVNTVENSARSIRYDTTLSAGRKWGKGGEETLCPEKEKSAV